MMSKQGMTIFVAVMAGVIGGSDANADPDRTVVTLYPAKDGTLLDGIGVPKFDGEADEADWYFNDTNYEGAIALATSTPASSFERRVVWEYDLGAVGLEPPVTARLEFVLFGALAYPRPEVDVHIYSYDSDLVETLDDFSAEPAVLQGVVTVPPTEPPLRSGNPYVVDVSNAVNDALTVGPARVAFRFQIDPDTPHPANEAFIIASESDETSKPALRINDAMLADMDDDDEIGFSDFTLFEPCMLGPDRPASGQCSLARLDLDTDVDLHDFATFQQLFGLSR